MGNTNSPNITTSNIYDERFKTFQESEFIKRLERKFAPLPYFKRFRALKNIGLFASYLFNVFSALTASTLVFFFVESMVGNYWLSGTATLLFLVVLETSKRKTAAESFKDWLQYRKASFGLTGILVLLVGLSVCFSFYGAKKLVAEFTPPPALEDATEKTRPLKEQLATIDSQIENHMANKNHLGEVYVRSQRAAESLTKQKELLLSQWMETENRTANNNQSTTVEHRQLTKLKAEHFAIVTLLLELLFLLCAWYLEYYDFRSFTEFAESNGNGSTDFATAKDYRPLQPSKNGNDRQLATMTKDNGTVAANNSHGMNGKEMEKDAILKAIKYVKGKIATAKYRIKNNIGRPETSEVNIKKFTSELRELETMLAKN